MENRRELFALMGAALMAAGSSPDRGQGQGRGLVNREERVDTPSFRRPAGLLQGRNRTAQGFRIGQFAAERRSEPACSARASRRGNLDCGRRQWGNLPRRRSDAVRGRVDHVLQGKRAARNRKHRQVAAAVLLHQVEVCVMLWIERREKPKTSHHDLRSTPRPHLTHEATDRSLTVAALSWVSRR